MSFRCQGCSKAQPVHSSPNRIVVQTRKKIYPERRDKEDRVIDEGGQGYEIVSEIQVCNGCARGEIFG